MICQHRTFTVCGGACSSHATLENKAVVGYERFETTDPSSVARDSGRLSLVPVVANESDTPLF